MEPSIIEQKFTTEVIDKMKYYVYRLIDPRNGETFYVGKGKGNRVFNHVKCLASENLDLLNDKLQTIFEIQSSGLKVIHVIHRHGMTEEQAFEVEAALIDAYPGVTNIAGGYGSNEFGPMNVLEIINKYSAVEAEISHKVIMITVNKSASERSIYHATRCAWKLNKNKAEQADFVLAVKQGIIVEVFKPSQWLIASVDHFNELSFDSEDRYGFYGDVADGQIRELYVNKRIPEKYRIRGAANPIKYSY